MINHNLIFWHCVLEALCAGLSGPWEAPHLDPVPPTSAGSTGEESTELPRRLGVHKVACGGHSKEATGMRRHTTAGKSTAEKA